MTATTTTPSVARFRRAQDKSWPQIAHELATGRKKTHWMWYVFPQLRGLAKSETAHHYGIADKEEALAYLDDQVLRVRLATATSAVLRQRHLMFSDVDRKKLRSCMTLFRGLVTDPTLPNAVLAKFYGGEQCQLTLDLLAGREIPEQWKKPAPRPPYWSGGWASQGRVETRVGKHWEDQVRAVQTAVAHPGNDTPMSAREIIAFLRRFNLPAATVRSITDRWVDDQNCAAQEGWDSCDAERYDN